MTVFLVLQIIIVIALVSVILVQKTSSDGFTGASSSPNSFLTGRATANLFTRTTAILAAAFLINSLALAYMASKAEKPGSLIEKALEDKKAETKNEKKVAEKSEKKDSTKKPVKVKIEDMDNSVKEQTSETKKIIEKKSEEIKQEVENNKDASKETVNQEDKTKPAKKEVPASE